MLRRHLIKWFKVFKVFMNEQCDEGDHLPPSHWYWNLRFTCNSWELKKLNCFWRSSSGYKIDGVIRWMINLLKKSPYKKTNDSVYPLPYCKTRWCENEQEVSKLIVLWLFFSILLWRDYCDGYWKNLSWNYW